MTGKPEAVRPIRSLIRGLDALTALHTSGGGLTVSETAKRARLPRTTAYRILETLRLSGFVERDADELYRATERGRALVGEGNPGVMAPKRSNGHADAA